MVEQEQPTGVVDSAVAEGGAYEIIKKRLLDQGKQLDLKIRELNQARLDEFGSSDMNVAARVRVRTENNCIARDIVQVGGHLLFGYNVFIGLKKETKIEDVFALFDVQENDNSLEMVPVPMADTFLAETGFVNDFEELYRYYKHTKLVELTIKNGKLLAGFQIGERMEDIRVFRCRRRPIGQQAFVHQQARSIIRRRPDPNSIVIEKVGRNRQQGIILAVSARRKQDGRIKP